MTRDGLNNMTRYELLHLLQERDRRRELRRLADYEAFSEASAEESYKIAFAEDGFTRFLGMEDESHWIHDFDASGEYATFGFSSHMLSDPELRERAKTKIMENPEDAASLASEARIVAGEVRQIFEEVAAELKGQKVFSFYTPTGWTTPRWGKTIVEVRDATSSEKYVHTLSLEAVSLGLAPDSGETSLYVARRIISDAIDAMETVRRSVPVRALLEAEAMEERVRKELEAEEDAHAKDVIEKVETLEAQGRVADAEALYDSFLDSMEIDPRMRSPITADSPLRIPPSIKARRAKAKFLKDTGISREGIEALGDGILASMREMLESLHLLGGGFMRDYADELGPGIAMVITAAPQFVDQDGRPRIVLHVISADEEKAAKRSGDKKIPVKCFGLLEDAAKARRESIHDGVFSEGTVRPPKRVVAEKVHEALKRGPARLLHTGKIKNGAFR